MKFEFNTMPYQRVHGKTPKGRGLWMFDVEDTVLEASGTLTEAKRKVKEMVLAAMPRSYKDYIDTVVIKVLP